MNEVTNEQIEEALKNKQYIGIMKKASEKFLKYMDEDEIRTCQLNALWNSMKNYKPKSKFTTYLYNYVKYECLNYMTFLEKSDITNWEMNKPANIKIDDINDLISILADKELEEIMVKRFVENKTLKEIGDEYNTSYETIRKKLKKSMKIIRDFVEEDKK